ncbi:MAG: hypothetical protein PHO79_00400 [Desulfoplanes sp.]|nr:hypothetical protein [Desulfoplanes sp.]
MTIFHHYAPLLMQEDNLVITANNEPALNELSSMVVQDTSKIGIIGDEFPFISNLNLLENITLGTMYHQNIPLAQARQDIQPSINALNMEHTLGRRKEMLSPKELILSQILRGISCGNSILFMLSPPTILTDTVIHAVAMVPHPLKIWIACHIKAAAAYDYLRFTTFNIDG